MIIQKNIQKALSYLMLPNSIYIYTVDKINIFGIRGPSGGVVLSNIIYLISKKAISNEFKSWHYKYGIRITYIQKESDLIEALQLIVDLFDIMIKSETAPRVNLEDGDLGVGEIII